MADTTNKDKTLEEQVASTILQASTIGKTITINGEEYEITDPTPATLMMVSAEVSNMPKVNRDSENILVEVLRTAKDSVPIIGRIAAILLLGAKRISQHREITVEETKKRWSWRKFRFVKETTISSKGWEMDYLAHRITTDLTISTISDFISKRLGEMQVGDFFGLTTSLSAVNILKQTKEVEETAHGE